MGVEEFFGQRNEEKIRVNKGRNIFFVSEIMDGREQVYGGRGYYFVSDRDIVSFRCCNVYTYYVYYRFLFRNFEDQQLLVV